MTAPPAPTSVIAPPRTGTAEHRSTGTPAPRARRTERPERPPHPRGPAPSRPQPSRPGRPRPRLALTTAGGRVEEPRLLHNAERSSQWDPLRFRPQTTAQEEHSDTRRSRAVSQSDPLPDPARTAAGLLNAVCQVLAGRRPVDHLARWTSLELFQALARRVSLAHRILGGQAMPNPRIVSMRAQLTLSGDCEASAVLDDGQRVRGAAMRLELSHGRWHLTALEIG